MELIVREAFENYKRGDRITDPAQVEKIIKSDNARHVIKTAGEETEK